jgi:hypothetical protein
MGLPGAGKTTLAKALAPRLNATHYNGDEVRANLSPRLGFAVADRIEQARRMGWLCDRAVEHGGSAIADFICPTAQTREAFTAGGPAFVIWVDRIKKGRFEDTNRLFEPPARHDLRVTADGTPEYWAEQAFRLLHPIFDSRKPTALLVGRYQPFHDRHKAMIVEAIEQVGQVSIALRDTHGNESADLFEYIRTRIEHSLRRYQGRFEIVKLPNVTDVSYGRDVGYAVERIDLDSDVQPLSASCERVKVLKG